MKTIIPLKTRIVYFLKGLLFWKGRRAMVGPVYTRNLMWSDLQFIFFPKGFEDKYGYLGATIDQNSYYFKYLYPLILALDYEARPKWCPRWFLRFLHVFGDDMSIVRVRYRSLYKLKQRLTKGIMFTDWKTKWSDYDLRISISAPKHLQDLADAIENKLYLDGRKEYLLEQLAKHDTEGKYKYKTVSDLEEIYTKTYSQKIQEVS